MKYRKITPVWLHLLLYFLLLLLYLLPIYIYKINPVIYCYDDSFTLYNFLSLKKRGEITCIYLWVWYISHLNFHFWFSSFLPIDWITILCYFLTLMQFYSHLPFFVLLLSNISLLLYWPQLASLSPKEFMELHEIPSGKAFWVLR